MKETKTIIFPIRFNPSVFKELADISFLNDTTVSGLIRKYTKEGLLKDKIKIAENEQK